MESVLRHTKTAHEIIVVDNGSSDGTRPYLRSLGSRIKLIANPENRGFAKAVNQGLRKAKGDFFLLLNNDVIVTRGYLEGLLVPFREDASVGVTAPFTGPQGADANARPEFLPFYRDKRGLEKFAWAHNRANSDVRIPVPPALFSCFCHLVRRDVVSDVGGMDERYSPAYCEDIDFFWRAVRKGWRLVRTGSSYVHHFWRTTALGNGMDYRALARKGKKIFVRKWGATAWREAQGLA